MSLDRNAPADDVLGKVGTFGNPYHGLVQGGSLTLPNATTKTWPQPDATTPDIAGSTHLLRRAGQPEVTRSVEQAAADTAAGFQWRNQAMLSGGKFQLYGRDLEGWVYVDPTGGRWLIEFVTPLETIFLGFTSTFSVQMQVSRFGSFGGASTSFTTTLTLTDWGQQGYPAIRSFPVDGTPENVNNAEFFLEAVTPSGSRAAISAHQLRTVSSLTSDPTIDVGVRHALGWLEISIEMVGGLPSLTLSVLKNRAQTLAVLQNSVTITPLAVIDLPPLIEGGGTTTARTREVEQLIEFTRLSAVWVDHVTEAWVWVSLRCSFEFVETSSYAGASGSTYTVQFNTTGTEYVALEVDGVEQTRVEVTLAGQFTDTATYDGVDPDVTIDLQGKAGTRTLTVEGSSYMEAGEDDPLFTAAPGEPVNVGSRSPVVGSSGPFAPEVDFLGAAFQLHWRYNTRLILAFPNPGNIFIDLCRQSGQVFGQRVNVVTSTINDYTYYPRVSPEGLSGSKITQPYSASERFYGSWCPHTGAVASMQSEPVCWV